jgi:hypothetical protein
MSKEKTNPRLGVAISKRDASDTKRILVYQCISNAGVVNPVFTFQLQSTIPADYDEVQVEQFQVIGTVSNNNVFILSSSLNNLDPLLTWNGFYTGYYTGSKQKFYNKLSNQITFQIQQVNSSNQLVTPTLAGNWYMTLILSFSKSD